MPITLWVLASMVMPQPEQVLLIRMQQQTDQQRRLIAQLNVFKDRLLDINTRNPSLLLRREVQSRCFDIAKLGPKVVREVYGRLVRGAAGVLFVPDSDDSPEAAKQRRHLQQLMRAANARADETGLQELYVGLCWLTGHLDARTFLRGPLVLVPAKLEQVRAKRGAGWHLQLEPDELMVNEAIAAAVRKHRGLRFADELESRVRDALDTLQTTSSTAGQVPTTLFTAVGQHLSECALQVEIPEAEQLHPLQPLTASTMPKTQVPLSLTAEIILGLFPQSSTALYSDMECLVEKALGGEVDLGIIDNLLEAAADPENEAAQTAVDLDHVPEASVHAVVSVDPSQYAALKMAQSAECLVVRGPPGTGKSQLIVNLVADAMSRDKRVLVVCQKRAALDVVFRRLDDVGLSGSAALVHDAVSDKADLYKRLNGLLQASASVMNGQRESAQNIAAEIDRDAHALRELVRPLGLSWGGVPLHDLYAKSDARLKPLLDIHSDLLRVDVAQLDRLCAEIEQARPGRIRFDSDGYVLAQRRNWADLGHVDGARLQQCFADLARRLLDRASLPNLPTAEAGAAMKPLVESYVLLRTRWYRWLMPRWWKARDAVRRAASWFGDVSVDSWLDTLEHYLSVASAIQATGTHMQPAWVAKSLKSLSQPMLLARGAEQARQALESDLAEIRNHDRVLAGLSAHARSLLEQCASKLDHGADWGRRVRQETFLHWIDAAETAHPHLRVPVAPSYHTVRQRLEAAVEARRQFVAQELAVRLRAKATTPTIDPAENAHPNRRGTTDWNKLSHELGKKRRVKSLRALVSEFSWPMKQIVRCWLASPEVVAEVFPLDRSHFDLVIFDEASQLTVERALPVLYRCKQVVIAGDEQQMPPSNFFSSAIGEEDETLEAGEEIGEARFADSLLSQGKRIYGFQYLAWHYRSRYQQLIEFSNHAFYDGMLQVAANLECADARPPIQWIPVKGVWMNQINPVEASRAVDELARSLHNHPEASVGIITFNQKQQEAICDEIDQRRLVDPVFDMVYARAESPTSGSLDDRPFVKNIENVQGDERDHIIFSIGYAPGPDGVMRRNFGPLGTNGGENRLNVAITRARNAVSVICSFEPDTLAVETAKNRGPLLLKQYLQYARAVSHADVVRAQGVLCDLNPEQHVPQTVSGTPSFDSPLEEQIYDALIARGLKLYTQWGAGGYHIDLVVVDPRNPNRLCLGIECDGARYHSGRSVRERDLARQGFLESRGWKIHRIWSRDWWQDPQREVQRVLELLPTLTPITKS